MLRDIAIDSRQFRHERQRRRNAVPPLVPFFFIVSFTVLANSLPSVLLGEAAFFRRCIGKINIPLASATLLSADRRRENRRPRTSVVRYLYRAVNSRLRLRNRGDVSSPGNDISRTRLKNERARNDDARLSISSTTICHNLLARVYATRDFVSRHLPATPYFALRSCWIATVFFTPRAATENG